MLEVGRYEIRTIETGRFRLDGGAMFGVVPRVLWERVAPADERHRIQLAMRSLVLVDRGAGRVIVVDTGAGHKWDDVERDRFAFEVPERSLEAGLARAGIRPEDVTDIVVTHLHFDHNGGLTEWSDGPGSSLRVRFPKARHWVHAGHLAHAQRPTEKDRASFLARDFEPLVSGGRFDLLEGESPACPFPGVEWNVVHGHTPYQLLPVVVGDGVRVEYLGDLVPTFAHLPVPWVMAYDNEPLKTLVEKRALLRRCAEGDVIVVSEHDPEIGGARLEVSGRPAVRERVDLS